MENEKAFSDGEEKNMNESKYRVGRGWWPLLDEYIPRLEAIGAKIEFDYEKYGTLRIELDGETEEMTGLLIELEEKSERICEMCGKDGVLREELSHMKTFCDNCYNKESENKNEQ